MKKLISILNILAFAIGCNQSNSSEASLPSAKSNPTDGSNNAGSSSSDPSVDDTACITTELPAAPAAAGQLVFAISSVVNPCDVSGYVVGYSDILKIQATSEGRYFFNNVPPGDHDVIITTGALQLGLTEDKTRGRRLKKVKSLAGLRTEKETDLPVSGAASGVVKLLGQTDHSGIEVYIPGTGFIAKTDSNGGFELANLPVGEHNFYVEKDGYHRGQVEQVDIQTDARSSFTDINLAISTGAEGFILLDFGRTGTTSRRVAVTIGATENATLMKIAEDDAFLNKGWLPISSSTEFTFTSDGAKTLYVKFSDANGLESSPFSSNSIDVRYVATIHPARDALAAASAGDKLLIAGGRSSGNSNAVDIYDSKQKSWSTATLSQSRSFLSGVAVGSKILFAGGRIGTMDPTQSNVVDIYDTIDGVWEVNHLSQARQEMLGAASFGSKAYIAGGHNGSVRSSVVDVYDASTEQWSVLNLSVGRERGGVAASNGKVLFAGGYSDGGLSSVVDIYDVESNTWSTANLSQPRFLLAGAVAGSKVLFAGGVGSGDVPSNVVDIYDTNAGTWSTATLSSARGYLVGASIGTKAVFVGGYHNQSGASAVADIFDAVTGTWTTSTISEPRYLHSVATVADRVVIAGGYNNGNGGALML